MRTVEQAVWVMVIRPQPLVAGAARAAQRADAVAVAQLALAERAALAAQRVAPETRAAQGPMPVLGHARAIKLAEQAAVQGPRLTA